MTARWEDTCIPDPYLGIGAVNTFPLLGSRFLTMQPLGCNSGNGVFLRGPCWDVINKGQSQLIISSQFCTGVCEDRTWASEAEDSPLFETVARERLVKTQQAGRRLSECCGNLWIVVISGGAVLTCTYKWSINWVSHPTLVCSVTQTTWHCVYRQPQVT
jgi:hypothetical protein